MSTINGKITTRRGISGTIDSATLHGQINVEEGVTPAPPQPTQGEQSIHGKVTTTKKVGGNIKSSSALSGELNDDVKNRVIKDYEVLINKPRVENVELIGNKHLPDFGIPYVWEKTTEEWNSEASLISVKGAFYIYTDYSTDDEGRNIPGIKIGDGLAYVIDLPFLSEPYDTHILNTIIHVTQKEKDFWNNKFRCYMNEEDIENLVFTTD